VFAARRGHVAPDGAPADHLGQALVAVDRSPRLVVTGTPPVQLRLVVPSNAWTTYFSLVWTTIEPPSIGWPFSYPEPSRPLS
jgi:hypothetical protein